MPFVLCHFVLAQLLLLLLQFESVISFQVLTQLDHHHQWWQLRTKPPWRNLGLGTNLSAKSDSTENTDAKNGSSSLRIRTLKLQKNNKNNKYSRSKKKKNTNVPSATATGRQNDNPAPQNPASMETWRIYGISVHPDDLVDVESFCDSTASSFIPPLSQSLQVAIHNKLKIPPVDKIDPSNIQIVRRSLDARKKLSHPVYNYVVDISLPASQRNSLRWRSQPGRMELLVSSQGDNDPPKMTTVNDDTRKEQPHSTSSTAKKTVVIVGMGPAGLFCALQMALKSKNNSVRPILLDRGQPVEKRGRDIGALMHRRSLDSESNFAFGEGGAGTWSDGKLTTRIGRNSETVRWVLELLVEFGAPTNILYGYI
jgi:hypothetical protein